MSKLTGFQKKHLKGLAHKIKPAVYIGHKGMVNPVVRAIDEALERHELIKVKFIDFKEKDQKKRIADTIEARTGCQRVGMLGHTMLFFRCNKDPDKRKIIFPERAPRG